MGDEISFPMVRYMNPINRMVPIFAICILYIMPLPVAARSKA